MVGSAFYFFEKVFFWDTLGHMQLLGSHERSRELHALHGAEEEDTQLQLWMVLWNKIRLVRGTVFRGK